MAVQKTLEDWLSDALAAVPRVLEQSARTVIRVIDEDKSTHGIMAGLIHADPALTWHVLRRVEELRPDHIDEIELMPEQALSLLGLTQLRELISGLPKVAANDQSDTARLLRLQARRSHLAAYLCRSFAARRHGPNVNALYLAALLHGMGEWMLVELGHGELVAGMMESDDPDGLITERLGFGLDRWITNLSDRWRFPSLLRSEYPPSPSQYLARLGVQISNGLALAAQRGWPAKTLENLGATAGLYLHQDTDQVLADVRRLSVDEARSTLDVGHPPAAAALPSIGMSEVAASEPQPKPSPAAVVEEPQAEPAARAFTAPEMAPPVRKKTKLLLPNTAFYSLTMQGMERNARSGVGAVLEHVVEGLHRGLGLHRVAFAARTRNADVLGVRFVHAWEQPCALTGAHLPMSPPNLLTKLMERTQSIWVREDNRERILPTLPEVLRRVAGDEDFFLMTLILNNRPIGLFYADRYHGHLPLDQQSYDGFRRLCTEVLKTLEKVSAKAIAGGAAKP